MYEVIFMGILSADNNGAHMRNLRKSRIFANFAENVIADVDDEEIGWRGGYGRDNGIGGGCGAGDSGGTRDGGIWHRGVAEGGAAEGNETGRAGENHRHVLSECERRQELQGSDRLSETPVPQQHSRVVRAPRTYVLSKSDE